MKVLNRSSIYAIRALLYIDRYGLKDEYTSINEISDKLNISFHFLTKILQTLNKNGIISSSRGPSGGVRLQKSTHDIILSQIVLLFEGMGFFDDCMLGLPGCSNDSPCPAHDFWTDIKTQLKDRLDESSIGTLSKLEGRIGLSELGEPY
ncbi:MAG: Rrf2 family transcriptional regulator [Cyclobacteriaceae bacterium]